MWFTVISPVLRRFVGVCIALCKWYWLIIDRLSRIWRKSRQYQRCWSALTRLPQKTGQLLGSLKERGVDRWPSAKKASENSLHRWGSSSKTKMMQDLWKQDCKNKHETFCFENTLYTPIVEDVLEDGCFGFFGNLKNARIFVKAEVI